ncbi:hypothetical protein Ddc_23979 [Ditylenchus destructor]|nr:hypothetical protein Ddc_23979 [Ditylenchus destructor]
MTTVLSFLDGMLENLCYALRKASDDEESQDEGNADDAIRHTLTFTSELDADEFRVVWNDDPGSEEDIDD